MTTRHGLILKYFTSLNNYKLYKTCRITTVLKVETDIITNIEVSQMLSSCDNVC